MGAAGHLPPDPDRNLALELVRVTEAAAIAAEHCHPVPDQRGPEDYKRHLVAELTIRALRRAAGRATGPAVGRAARRAKT